MTDTTPRLTEPERAPQERAPRANDAGNVEFGPSSGAVRNAIRPDPDDAPAPVADPDVQEDLDADDDRNAGDAGRPVVDGPRDKNE